MSMSQAISELKNVNQKKIDRLVEVLNLHVSTAPSHALTTREVIAAIGGSFSTVSAEISAVRAFVAYCAVTGNFLSDFDTLYLFHRDPDFAKRQMEWELGKMQREAARATAAGSDAEDLQGEKSGA